jgi:hypothetical protein
MSEHSQPISTEARERIEEHRAARGCGSPEGEVPS